MKVIDLLNKIANEEEVPESIMYKGEQYEFCNGNYTYCDENNCDRWLFDDIYRTIMILNDEVELIEEQQYIDIQNLEEYEFPAHAPTNAIGEKLLALINENRNAIKQLDRNIRKEK